MRAEEEKCMNEVVSDEENGVSNDVGTVIASPQPMTIDGQESASILSGEEKEVRAKEFIMCAEKKECTNEGTNNEEGSMSNSVERMISSPQPMAINGDESALILSGEGKEVLAKAFKMHAEEKECPNRGVNYEENDGSNSAEMTKASPQKKCKNEGVNDGENANEVANQGDMKEELKMKRQVKANSRTNANKSRKIGKGIKVKKGALMITKVMAKRKIGQEPSVKSVAYESIVVSDGEDDNKLMKQGVDTEEKADEGMTNKEDEHLSNVIVGGAEWKEEVNMNEKAGEEMTNNEYMKEAVKKRELVKAMPKNKVQKSRKAKLGRKKKGASTGMDVLVPKNTREQESSDKKLEKKAKCMGMIFMCSSKTKQDCYTYKVLGLPASRRDLVLTVFEGMKLFLYDVDLKLLYGVYKAAGPGGYNIEPKAFKSAFPSQVRFSVHEDCLPIPEEKFKSVIKDNYYKKNKFSCELTSEQVSNLCKLFRAASKRLKSNQWQKSVTLERPKPVGTDRIRKRQQARAGDTFVDRERPRKRLREVVRSQYVNQDRSRKQHREVERPEFVDRDRSKKQRRETERSEYVEPERSWKQCQEHDRYPDYGRDRVYRDGMDVYERRVYASPVAPLLLHPLLPAPSEPALPLSYSYDRSLEMNVSRRPPISTHRDRPFLDLDLRRHENIDYRRDMPNDYREGWFRDSESRHLDYANLHYKERPTYYDYAAQPSAYYPTGGTSRDAVLPPPEYRPIRSIYRY